MYGITFQFPGTNGLLLRRRLRRHGEVAMLKYRWRGHSDAGGSGNPERVIWNSDLPARRGVGNSTMPQAKIRMRRLLIVLAILMLLLPSSRYAIESAPRWSSCQKVADEHAYMEHAIGQFIQRGAKIVPAYDDGPSADAKTLLEYHTRMRKKYRLAAWCPWNVIPPDPPIPTLK